MTVPRARVESLRIHPVRDECTVIFVPIALQIVRIDAHQAIAPEEAELGLVGLRRPVAILGHEDVRRTPPPADIGPSQRPVGEWIGAGHRHIEVPRLELLKQPSGESQLFPGGVRSKCGEFGKAFEPLAWNRSDLDVAIEPAGNFRAGADQGDVLPGFCEFLCDREKRDLRAASDAMQSRKCKQDSHSVLVATAKSAVKRK